MTNVNISIKEEAYRFLKSFKSKDKSFSDVILRFKEENKRRNIMRFFGVLKDVNWDAREKRMHEFREEFEARFK